MWPHIPVKLLSNFNTLIKASRKTLSCTNFKILVDLRCSELTINRTLPLITRVRDHTKVSLQSKKNQNNIWFTIKKSLFYIKFSLFLVTLTMTEDVVISKSIGIFLSYYVTINQSSIEIIYKVFELASGNQYLQFSYFNIDLKK